MATLTGPGVSEQGLRDGIAEAVQQLELLLTGVDSGSGPVGPGPAARACRQIWHWVRHELVPRALVEQIVHEQTAGLNQGGRVFDLFVQIALGPRRP